MNATHNVTSRIIKMIGIRFVFSHSRKHSPLRSSKQQYTVETTEFGRVEGLLDVSLLASSSNLR